MPEPETPVTYLRSTFEEALLLTRESRDYIAYQLPRDREPLEPAAQIAASCEAMRITARLTHVMAWLLIQRAVEAGELTKEQAAEAGNRLGGQDVCESGDADSQVFANGAGIGSLPPRLDELLIRSLALYQRVARLDSQLN